MKDVYIYEEKNFIMPDRRNGASGRVWEGCQ